MTQPHDDTAAIIAAAREAKVLLEEAWSEAARACRSYLIIPSEPAAELCGRLAAALPPEPRAPGWYWVTSDELTRPVHWNGKAWHMTVPAMHMSWCDIQDTAVIGPRIEEPRP